MTNVMRKQVCLSHALVREIKENPLRVVYMRVRMHWFDGEARRLPGPR
jgi:hypothetical protein